VTAPTLTTAAALADQLLADFPARAAERQAQGDWGVPLLAGLRADRTGPALAAVTAWAAGLRGGIDHCGLFGRGLAGCLLGLTHASAVEPRLVRPAATVRRHVVARCAAVGLRRSGVGWSDYDLIMGVSGAVLALAACPGEAADLEPAARYLLDLCDRDDLARLVVGDDYGNPGLSWNLGRLNHGLGHGVPGVLAALLTARTRMSPAWHDQLDRAIGRLADHLCRAAYRDGRGVVSWPPGSRIPGDPAPGGGRRQAWCYGTPGVAWQLTEAGRLLGDDELREFGIVAMTSLCDAWDDEYYLDTDTPTNRLAFCHGLAGQVAIARAFGDRVGMSAASALAEHLATVLTDELPAVVQLSTTDLSMLNGAPGVLAVLLSDNTDHAWFVAVGLARP
jgi:lantibiotic biosynthesis protein